MQIYMYVHNRERDSRPGFYGVKIKLLLLLLKQFLRKWLRRHDIGETSGNCSNHLYVYGLQKQGKYVATICTTNTCKLFFFFQIKLSRQFY